MKAGCFGWHKGLSDSIKSVVVVMPCSWVSCRMMGEKKSNSWISRVGQGSDWMDIWRGGSVWFCKPLFSSIENCISHVLKVHFSALARLARLCSARTRWRLRGRQGRDWEGGRGGLCSSPGESKAQTVSGRQRARKKDKKKEKGSKQRAEIKTKTRREQSKAQAVRGRQHARGGGGNRTCWPQVWLHTYLTQVTNETFHLHWYFSDLFL